MMTLLLAIGWARAEDPDALLYLARPAATPGGSAEVAVAWQEASVNDVVLEPLEGARLGAVTRTASGAHAVVWPDGGARRGGVRARVQGRDGVWHDAGSVGVASTRALEPVLVGVVPAGASEARVRFPDGAAIAAHARVLRVSEGSVVDAVEVDDALEVRLKLGPDRTARVVAVALFDARTPGAMPNVALLRVHARTELAFPAEPGTTAWVRVGRRTLGPFSAGDDGRIVAPVEVVPADTTWELQATDLAGNVQRTSGPLPSRASPVLLGIDPATPSEDAAWLFGWTPAGGPLLAAPSCVGDGGVRPAPVRVEDGVWRVRYPGAGTGAVECASATSSVTMRAARQEPTLAQVALSVRPGRVSVDFPYAQVEAAVLDSRGARLSPAGLRLHGMDGVTLGPVTEGADALTAEVDARTVAREGRFTIEATWTAPPSRDIPARLDAEAWRDADTVRVRVGVRDARGLPVEGAAVTADAGESVRESRTDVRGDAWIDLTAGSAPLVRVTAGALTYWVRPRTAPLPATVRGPDLSTRHEVPVVAGRALAVELPSPLGVVRLGERVQLRARVRDASGGVLTDVVPRFSATVGRVDAPVLVDDIWVAAWSDDGENVLGDVRVRATVGAEGAAPSAEARWSVQPPPVRGSVALLAGAALNAGNLTPMLGGTLHTTTRWLPELLSVRVGVTGQTYEGAAQGATDATSATVSARLLPIDLGLAAGRRDGRRSLDAHVSVLFAPYQIRVRYGDQVTLTGFGISDAGVAVGGSAGWRTGRTELYGEVRYVVYGASGPLLTFERPLGGPSVCLGYRFPW